MAEHIYRGNLPAHRLVRQQSVLYDTLSTFIIQGKIRSMSPTDNTLRARPLSPPAKFGTKVAAAVVLTELMCSAVHAVGNTTPLPTQSDRVSVEMCATSAFRKNHVNACEESEAANLARPRASARASVVPAGSVPTTSPNYRSAGKLAIAK